MPVWLAGLLATALVLYTDDYVIAGVLPEIAADLGVSEANAGQLVTAFSLTVAVTAPIAAVVLRRVPRRTIFTCSLALFACINLCAAASTSLIELLALRVVAAVAAAATTPALFAYAAENAPSASTGRYVAVVALGVTGSIALGVPFGTWIGGRFGWRITFVVMAAAGVIALICLLTTLPNKGKPSGEVPQIFAILRSLAKAPVSFGLLMNTLLMTGSMMMLTYTAPYLEAVSSASVDQRALSFSLSGFAGMVCIYAGGRACDRWGPDRTLVIGISVFICTMIALGAFWWIRPVPFAVLAVVSMIWGGMAFWNSPAIQARLYLLAGPSMANQALAMNTSGTYLGVALGGAFGGTALTFLGPEHLPVIAGVLGLASLGSLGAGIKATKGSDDQC